MVLTPSLPAIAGIFIFTFSCTAAAFWLGSVNVLSIKYTSLA